MRYKPLLLGLLSVVFVLSVVSARADGDLTRPRKVSSKWNRRVAIFNGENLDGWVTQDGAPASAGWEVVDGTLHLVGKGSGMILTQRLFGEFDLRFEWKITEGGNSGIKYRVRDYDGARLGIEYQLLDDPKYFDGILGKGSTGSLYALYSPVKEGGTLPTNPPGQFNSSRIVVKNNQITHWLNGVKLVTARVGSTEWHERVAASKFRDREGFGENFWGTIMLQEHGSEVWFRNVTIRELSRPWRRNQHGGLIPVVGHARR